MESWRLVWRDGFAPILSTPCLEALAEALRTDDPRLTQGSTTTPPPLMCVQDWPVEAGCFLVFMGAVENGGFACTSTEAVSNQLGVPPHSNAKACTVGQAEEFFARLCFEADQRLGGEPAACRWLLNWFDNTPRNEMRRELLAEVELALVDRLGCPK